MTTMTVTAEADPVRAGLLVRAEAAGWPRLQAGRLVIGPGEIRWRQGVTLMPPTALPALEAALSQGARHGE